MTEHTPAEIDEALRWATAGGVRVQAYIDQLLDARLALMSCDAQG